MSQPSQDFARVTVKAFGLSDMGRVRKNNEDAFLVAHLERAATSAAPSKIETFEVVEHPVLLAVSDGMGGAEAGEVASALVVESLRRAMTGAKGDWGDKIREAAERSNREVWNAAAEPGRAGMGATLTAVCIEGTHAHIAEVGDSRAYLIRGRRIRQVTRDQSFVQVLIDSGALKPEEASQYPMKNVVLQAMGQGPDVKVAIGRLELRRGDQLLLCSDGLSNKVSDEEMRAALEGRTPLDAACVKLIALANDRGGEDNITVVIAEVDGLPLEIHREAETVTQTFKVITEYSGESPDADDLMSGDDEDHEVPAPRSLRSVEEASAAKAPTPAAKPALAKAVPAKAVPAKAVPAKGTAIGKYGPIVAIAIVVAAAVIYFLGRG